MSPRQYILASLRQHLQVHLAVVLGVAVATAVITGALLVGDSVRGSLRNLAVQRLGRIDFAVLSHRLFRAELAGELQTSAEFADEPTLQSAQPALLLEGALVNDAGEKAKRASDVAIIGFDGAFWQLGDLNLDARLSGDVIAITQSLADQQQLAVKVGDEVLLRLERLDQQIPSDTLLGEKSDTVISKRLTVAAILPPKGLARFGLRPSQQLPRNAFVPLGVLQQMLESPGKANAILIAGSKDASPIWKTADNPIGDPAHESALTTITEALRPTLVDYGLEVNVRQSAASTFDSSLLDITSKQLLVPSPVVDVAQRLAGDEVQPVITYLANKMSHGDQTLVYSMIAGVQSTAQLGPLLDDQGKLIELAEDEIAVNDWAAEHLDAQIGDEITITFYEPESQHGELTEHPPATLKLAAIVPLADANGKPTAAADPHLTPTLEGVTDKESINNWELPFELVEPLEPHDDEYWQEHSTTPKAFVALATARKLWESRYGVITSLRVPPTEERTVERFQSELAEAIDPAQLGITVLPVKAQAIAASTGTTAFEQLFLGFSFFLIAAAVMLVALLFRLGVQQRASEIGLLLTTGITMQKVRSMLAIEATLVATIGALLGVLGGIAYAWLMILGLRTRWVEAISTPFIQLQIEPTSLLIGLSAGGIVSILTVLLTVRRIVRLPPRQLLTGDTAPRITIEHASRRAVMVASGLAAVAVICAAAGIFLSGQPQALAFLAGGAAALAAALVELWRRWRSAHDESIDQFGLTQLAHTALSRNANRSILAASLIASASFLIVAISAFQLDPSEQGTGGFDIVAESSVPVHYDLNSSDDRALQLGFTDEEDAQLTSTQIYGFRVKDGNDASCLNLYQTRQPRMLGVPADFVKTSAKRDGFAWASRGHASDEQSPWQLLQRAENQSPDSVPIILDANTSTYSLHLKGVGDTLQIEDEFGNPVTLRVAALLSNSMLQGVVLMSEENIRKLYPTSAGQRFFLIDLAEDAPPLQETSELLENRLEDYGLDAESATATLARFLVVQNTYLETFQMLGALGMLLGTFGLAVVELRSVLERRGEFAVMRATGFARKRLSTLVLFENAALLLIGLSIGVAAALVALLPHLFTRAHIPLGTLAAMLLVIAVVGMLAGILAVRAVNRIQPVTALKAE